MLEEEEEEEEAVEDERVASASADGLGRSEASRTSSEA